VLEFGIFDGWIGKELLHRMLWMTFFLDYILPSVIGMCVVYYIYLSNCSIFMLSGTVGRVGNENYLPFVCNVASKISYS
jgi:hypothetical protein